MTNPARLVLAIGIVIVAVAIPIKSFIDTSNAANEARQGMNAELNSFRRKVSEHKRFSERLRKGL